jgi:hypothetical protein
MIPFSTQLVDIRLRVNSLPNLFAKAVQFCDAVLRLLGREGSSDILCQQRQETQAIGLRKRFDMLREAL